MNDDQEGLMPHPSLPASAAERAYALLRERIVSGDVPGGTLLSEGEVSAELGMSRTPVREAFLRLQAEGWMQLFPKRGALVRPVQPGEIREVIETRHLIEAAAVRKATATPDGAADLAAILAGLVAEQRSAAEARDLVAFTDADVAFHQAVVESGRNSILTSLYATLRDRQQRMTARSVHAQAERIDVIIAQHADLAERIADCDATGFERGLLAHMFDIHQGLLQ
jgi:DNA-binding GntR family transcriptional regulator